jgi:uncharacterized protein YodC (DUF2158 family)
MELLRVVITFDAKKDFDVVRQTTYIKMSDFKTSKKVPIKIRGKHKIKEMTIELVDSVTLTKLIPKGGSLMNPGDVVMLKSGGPKMTISGEAKSDVFPCIWFVCEAVQKDEFPECALKIAKVDALKTKKTRKRVIKA